MKTLSRAQFLLRALTAGFLGGAVFYLLALAGFSPSLHVSLPSGILGLTDVGILSAIIFGIVGIFATLASGLFALYWASKLFVGFVLGATNAAFNQSVQTNANMAAFICGFSLGAMLLWTLYNVWSRLLGIFSDNRKSMAVFVVVILLSAIPVLGTFVFWWLVVTPSAPSLNVPSKAAPLPVQSQFTSGLQKSPFVKNVVSVGLIILSLFYLGKQAFDFLADPYLVQKDLNKVLKHPARYKYLNVSGQELKQIPSAVGDMEKLEMLNLNVNQVETLPAEFAKLQNLKKLYASANNFREVPEALFELKHLEVLEFDRNPIADLPAQILDLVSLQKLCLSTENLNAAALQLLSEYPKEGSDCYIIRK